MTTATNETTDRIRIRGEASSRRVWINDRELLPGPSQAVSNHSPDGFNWGYGGSGPSQLALAILLEDQWRALANYQNFKWDYISKLPVDADFDVDITEFWDEWIDRQTKRHFEEERKNNGEGRDPAPADQG